MWLNKIREMSGVLYAKRNPIMLKGKFYEIVETDDVVWYSILDSKQHKTNDECRKDEYT